MKNIIKLEFVKTLGYPGFRTIVILHIILFFLVVLVASNFKIPLQAILGTKANFPISALGINKLFAFPYVWATISWIASWFNILLGILVIMLVGNEYQFRTFRKQILDGVSRNQMLNAKMIIMATLAFYALILVLFTGLVFGIIYSDSFTLTSIFEKIPFVLVLFIQSFAYMMLGMLFALIFKSNSISIITFILFFFPGEPILRAFFPDSIDRFFPIKIISNLTPMPDFVEILSKDIIQINGKAPASLQSMGLLPDTFAIWISTLVCLGYIAVFYYASKMIIERRNF